ncbi:MAG: type II toxin-antitoxin system PemK/MazF family toxin [Epsilonproteobacteria bacterium]|nr:type II toxin-antitoxin system PemK/MazF family toxin [Campylobacterota bacterium]
MNQYDVYLADLNPTIGREQQGTRPVLVISNSYENLLDVVTIIPITSLKKGRRVYPNEFLLKHELELPSILLCQQIRTISKKRLIKKLTSLDNPYTRQDIVNILCRRFEEMD